MLFLSSIPERSKYLTIMDDLLLYSSLEMPGRYVERSCPKEVWKYHQESVNSLELNYNTWVTLFFIKDKRVCIKPLKNKARSDTKTVTITDSKILQIICRGGKLFECVLSHFYKFLKSTCHLTRKGRPFILTKNASRLLKTPVLQLPDNRGRFPIVFR